MAAPAFGVQANSCSAPEIQIGAHLRQAGRCGREPLLRAIERMHLTARGYRRVLRVGRTIADLDGTPQIRRAHVAEARSFRRIAPERR